MLSHLKMLGLLPFFPAGAVRRVYYFAKLSVRGDEVQLEKLRINHQVPILNLHRVSPHKDQFWGSLQPKLFDELLGYLKKRFRLTTFAELRAKGDPSDELPPLVISFDDGFQDFLEFAVPILRKHGIRANMNIIPKYCESGLLPWNILLYDFLQRAPDSLIREIRLPGFQESMNHLSGRQKQKFGLAISAYFKNRSAADREKVWQVVSALIEKWGEKPQFRMMNTSEVKQIASEHELGAHSYAHDSMGFETMDYFLEDLDACKRYFQTQLNIPLTIYAFPNGSYRYEQVEKLLSLGMEHVLLVNEKCSLPGNRIHPRYTIYGDSLSELVVRSLGVG